MPARERVPEGEQHRGDARQGTADHRQEVDQGDPERPEKRERNARDHQRQEHDAAGDERGHEVPQHVPGDRAVDLPGHLRVPLRPVRRHHAEQAGPHLGALEQQQQRQHEDGQQRDHQRERALAQAQGRRREALAEVDELRRVALHPVLHVVLARQVPDPALAVLGLVHVRRQCLGQVGDRAHQRQAERQSQADEHDDGPQRDDGHGPAAALDPPPLQGHHHRIQDQRDEPGHQDQQEDVPQPVDQLAEQEGDRHDRDGDQDRAQRYPTDRRRLPQPCPAGIGLWQLVGHLTIMTAGRPGQDTPGARDR